MTAQSLDAVESRTMSIDEAAKVLGIGRTTAYELSKQGRFPVRILRLGRKIRVSRTELDRYLAGTTEP